MDIYFNDFDEYSSLCFDERKEIYTALLPKANEGDLEAIYRITLASFLFEDFAKVASFGHKALETINSNHAFYKYVNYFVGHCYYFGLAVKKDDIKAIALLEEAIKAGLDSGKQLLIVVLATSKLNNDRLKVLIEEANKGLFLVDKMFLALLKDNVDLPFQKHNNHPFMEWEDGERVFFQTETQFHNALNFNLKAASKNKPNINLYRFLQYTYLGMEKYRQMEELAEVINLYNKATPFLDDIGLPSNYKILIYHIFHCLIKVNPDFTNEEFRKFAYNTFDFLRFLIMQYGAMEVIELKTLAHEISEILEGRFDKETAEYFKLLEENTTHYLTNKSVCSYETALAIAAKAHEGIVDKVGKPYIEHPKFVASLCRSNAAKCVALLHDVIEDTDITENELMALTRDKIVTKAVSVLSKKEGMTPMEYYALIATHPLAIEVKAYDIYHNSLVSRWDNPSSEEAINNCKKYTIYFSLLVDIVGVRMLSLLVDNTIIRYFDEKLKQFA